MNLEELVSKYIQNAQYVFEEIKILQSPNPLGEEKISPVIETARRYLEDAKYYRNKNKLDAGLASVAYCEGLLDALRLLGVVEFSWQGKKGKKEKLC